MTVRVVPSLESGSIICFIFETCWANQGSLVQYSSSITRQAPDNFFYLKELNRSVSTSSCKEPSIWAKPCTPSNILEPDISYSTLNISNISYNISSFSARIRINTLCSERCRVSCFGKLFEIPFLSGTTLYYKGKVNIHSKNYLLPTIVDITHQQTIIKWPTAVII